MTAESINFLKFNNPTLGELLFAEVLQEIVKFMGEQPDCVYRVMIGSDSNGIGSLDLVSVIAVHRVGNGGRYFWYRQSRSGIKTLRQKIYSEVEASLELASIFLPAFQKSMSEMQTLEMPFDFQIHVDVGMNGETRSLVHEVTGMVTAYGFSVAVKPESQAATTVADKHVHRS